MKRPSKKEIRDAIQKLHETKSSSGPSGSAPLPGKTQEKKGSQNQIRKKSAG